MVGEDGIVVPHAHLPHGENINDTLKFNIPADRVESEHVVHDIPLQTNLRNFSPITASFPNYLQGTSEKYGTCSIEFEIGNIVSCRAYRIEKLPFNLLSHSGLDEIWKQCHSPINNLRSRSEVRR